MSPEHSPALAVLAAGMGSRYGGLKQIDAVGPNGATIIDYSIYDAVRAGFGKVVFIIRKDIETAFRESIGARFEGRVQVEYAFQELNDLPAGFASSAGRTKPWGTTHAILAAEKTISGPFAVINADDFYGAESFRVLARYLKPGGSDYAMVGFVLRNTLSDFGSVARGVCQVSREGLLQGVVELTSIARAGDGAMSKDAMGRVRSLTGDEIVSMNMWGFTPAIFGQLRAIFRAFLQSSGHDLRAESYIPSAVNELVAAERARVCVLPTSDSWFGVTYREDRPQVVEKIQTLIAAGKYPETLWA